VTLTLPSIAPLTEHDDAIRMHALANGIACDVGRDGIAVFSQDSLYRYYLTRTWDRESPPKLACWIMCNPSTADAFVLDPTIRRCVAFSKREGCTGLIVVNLYAYRSVKPDVLNHVDDPIGGARNALHISLAISVAHVAIAAWGAFRARGPDVRHLVFSLAEQQRAPLFALRLTADGSPGHPLYIPADAPLIAMRPAIYFTTE
jgi:hypothetical protein